MSEEKKDFEPVSCPINPSWVKGMLKVLPAELQGKLVKYRECPGVRS
jgi:hypothetical protein